MPRLVPRVPVPGLAGSARFGARTVNREAWLMIVILLLSPVYLSAGQPRGAGLASICGVNETGRLRSWRKESYWQQ